MCILYSFSITIIRDSPFSLSLLFTLVCQFKSLAKKTSHVWSQLPKNYAKLNFAVYFLSILVQVGIGGGVRDYQGTMIKTYSKPVGEGFKIKTKILALMEDLVRRKHWTFLIL